MYSHGWLLSSWLWWKHRCSDLRTYISTVPVFWCRQNRCMQKQWTETHKGQHPAAGKTQKTRLHFRHWYAFRQLRDDHGMMAVADSFYRYPAHAGFSGQSLSPVVKAAFAKAPNCYRHYSRKYCLPAHTPSMNVQNQEGVDKLASRLAWFLV